MEEAGWGGGWGWGGGRQILYLSQPCHHQNDSCIKMCSEKSHLNVSLLVMDIECLIN